MSREIILFFGVLVITLLDRLKNRFWVFALLALPSTFFHELMHFLIALLTHGRPKSLSLLPRRDGGYYHLGHVQVANLTSLNAPFIGMAPLLLIPLAWWMTVTYLPTHADTWHGLGWGYFIASLLYGSLPSGSDWRIVWRSPVMVLGIGALGLLAIWAVATDFWKPATAKTKATLASDRTKMPEAKKAVTREQKDKNQHSYR